MVVLGLYSGLNYFGGCGLSKHSCEPFFQEVRMKRKLDKIIVLTTPKATTVREGKEQTIDQRRLWSASGGKNWRPDCVVVEAE
jgi:hypothetical protein